MPSPAEAFSNAVSGAPMREFHGRVWRTHWSALSAIDWSPSMRRSGRYHQGSDLFPENQIWPALYTSLSPEIAVWEMVRRSAQRNLAYLQNNLLTELRVDVSRVADVSDPGKLGLDRSALTGPNVAPCRALARAARAAGIAAMLVPSAAIEGLNLVLLPDNLPPEMPLLVISTRELPIELARERP